jgi:hypothetical protein
MREKCVDCRYFPSEHEKGCWVGAGTNNSDYLPVTKDSDVCERYSPRHKFCDRCGQEMEMYFKFYCPWCDKPEPETKEVWNFVKVLTTVERVSGRKGIKSRLWAFMNDYGNYKVDNDSYAMLPVYMDEWSIKESPDEFKSDTVEDGEIIEYGILDDLKTLREMFGWDGKKKILFEITW